MEAFKVRNCISGEPPAPFPRYRTLAPATARRLYRNLLRASGWSDGTEEQSFLMRLAGLRRPHWAGCALDAEFRLDHFLRQRGITAPKRIYINWDRFQTIDTMRFADLVSHLRDIWYPSADDIELFDRSFSWILFVRHDGALRAHRFPSTSPRDSD